MNETATYTETGLLDRDQLIRAHLPLVNFLVERMVTQVPTFVNKDEICSAAMLGLVDAANRYDPSKGVQFKTFAERRIRGAVLDEVRRMDWFSRSLREKHARLARTIERLERKLGRAPEEEEIAAELDMPLEEYQSLLGEVSYLGCISLNESLDDHGGGRTIIENLEDENGKSPLDELEAADLTREMAEHISKLSEKERLVVALYYHEELTQKEIAEVLGISEGRVSQIHSQALLKLKVKLSRRTTMPPLPKKAKGE
ncbi:RNA polymerase sigma-28 (SigD/FliA/WhiG) subunit [Geothermobacter ehrlichii]|uniref:RNA polymerase sigma-28 (SigD/FliA/WhiG) subunit n=1 Tax=Geothermobacter ehrlichii TaxID=213224 RepID=A0A5D3WQW3_9BACT|nr:FliA/WhiG family RNA polymerase sigma factor [Geothermobacter ehrlichii]TYP00190.1 RNA polymerase sigma-28 (SigD/FliA/WhiG) subunit [Geothermobacter ehrlichii]